MSKYGEPWIEAHVSRNHTMADIEAADGKYLATVWVDPRYALPNVRPYRQRIVAAVNACAGLSDEALAAGVVGRLAALLRESEQMAHEDTMHHCMGCGSILARHGEQHDQDCEQAVLLALLGRGAVKAEGGNDEHGV